MRLALFDFDGTLTTRDTFSDFLRFSMSPSRRILGSLMLAPLVLGYRSGHLSAAFVRPRVSRFAFWGRSAAQVRGFGERYAKQVIPGLLDPAMLARMRLHRESGDRVVLVSASLDAYLEPWCRAEGVELICTQLEQVGARLTGRYVQGDCAGAEKLRRIRAAYELESYDEIHAYGDTVEDFPMLEIADHRFLCGEELGSWPPAASGFMHPS